MPMPTDLPIACSLSASERPTRLAEMAAVGRAALVDVRATGTRAELLFAASGGVHDRVGAIVAAEAQCCAFLDMTVSEEPGGMLLTIDAPDGAEIVLAELVDAFRGTTQAA